MLKHFVLPALVLSAVAAFGSPTCAAAEADSKQLEAQFEKLLDAYNKDDVKAFFAEWAKSVEALQNEMVYNALYKDAAKKDVGAYVPKTLKLRKEGSVLEGDFLLVFFEAEFANAKKGLITANLQNEDGKYKFIQLRMEKAP